MYSTSSAAAVSTLPAWAARVELPGGRAIREARPEEYPAAEDLLVAAFTTGCWVSPDYEQGLRTLSRRAETFHIWVAVDAADRLLGIVLTPRPESHPGPDFSFSILAVGPLGRGLGLGGHLVDHATNLARAYGFTGIEIHSSPQMSQAHRLYYSKGFVRRIDRETVIVSEYDERLLTFTQRVTAPLPPAEVLHVEPVQTAGGTWFGRRRPLDSLPPAPPGWTDEAGAFVPDPEGDPLLADADRLAARLDRAGRLAAADGETERLARRIEADLWAGAQAVLWSPDDGAARAALQVFVARLDSLEARLAHTGRFLGGVAPDAADVLLFRVALAYDLAWRAAFPPASGGVADWPRLWNQARSLLRLAGLGEDERRSVGLAARDDGSYAEPFGPLPPVFDLPNVRQGWLSEPNGLRRRRPPRIEGVPDTPWSGPLPPAQRDQRARLASLLAEVERAGHAAPAGDQPLVATVAEDLAGSLTRLAAGADALEQRALRRVFHARLGWFDQRVAAASRVPAGAGKALLPVLRAYGEGLEGVLPPIDPVLADYPALAAWLDAAGDCTHS